MTDQAGLNRSIASVATQQYGLITRAQLLESGFSASMVDSRRRAEQLLPAGRGVYALGRPADGRFAANMAAALIVNGEAAVSGRAAADLWGFHQHAGHLEVVVEPSRRGSDFALDRRGVVEAKEVRLRRSRILNPRCVTRFQGIPILRAAWVLLELAGQLETEQFENAFREAERLRLLPEAELRACASMGRGLAGIAHFRAMVDRCHPKMKDVRTLLERLFLDICIRHGIELPLVNREKGRYYPDFRWEGIKLIVEVDGYEGHAGRLAFLEDAARENELRAMGYQVIRFTWEEVTQQPEKVARLVAGDRPMPEADQPGLDARLKPRSTHPVVWMDSPAAGFCVRG